MRPVSAAPQPEPGSPTDAELIAHVLAGAAPSAAALRWGARLAAVPPWQRGALGAARLEREHRLPRHHALRIAAAWQLADRWSPDERPAVTSPRDALLLLTALRTARREEVWAIMLDARHRPLDVVTVVVGGINSARLAARDIFAPALRAGAAAFIVAHNHPSGDATPSRADRQVTAVLRGAAELMGLPILDHLIVTGHGHHSFREDEGWTVVS